MSIRKAVVTAAGWGTRFLPATKAQPKEMLPLVDKPIIQYVIEEAVASGIEHIVVVTAGGKRAIEDHFDRSFELEEALNRKGDQTTFQKIKAISEIADLYYVRQKQQLGLGHAISCARDFIGNEPFAVFLPDDVIDASTPCMAQMVQVFDRYQCSVIGVERVPEDQIEKYGIIDGQSIEQRLYQISNLVEKPPRNEAPTNLGIVGRYILTPEIFEMIDRTTPGKGGEIQLTDALKLLLRRQAMYAYEFEGVRYDAGTPIGLLQASIEVALRRPDIGPQLREYLKSLDLENGRRSTNGHAPERSDETLTATSESSKQQG